MSDTRDELLAALRDALEERLCLHRKMCDSRGASARDANRAGHADHSIVDLLIQLRGSGVERVFCELEARPELFTVA